MGVAIAEKRWLVCRERETLVSIANRSGVYIYLLSGPTVGGMQVKDCLTIMQYDAGIIPTNIDLLLLLSYYCYYRYLFIY